MAEQVERQVHHARRAWHVGQVAAVDRAGDDRLEGRRVPATPVGTPAMLIRPDGYVAWSGTDPDGLKAALTRWFS